MQCLNNDISHGHSLATFAPASERLRYCDCVGLVITQNAMCSLNVI